MHSKEAALQEEHAVVNTLEIDQKFFKELEGKLQNLGLRLKRREFSTGYGEALADYASQVERGYLFEFEKAEKPHD